MPGVESTFLQNLRDIIIIIWGILSVVLLLTLTVVVLMLGLSVKRLVSEVNDLMNNGVKPVLASTRESVDNVTGTTRFLGDKVVAPAIRAISIIAGIRRGIAIFSGLTGRSKKKQEGA